MAIALSTHIKRKRRSILGVDQQSSESSETVDEPCNHKKLRRAETAEGSASLDANCESQNIKNAPSQAIEAIDDIGHFQEVSHEEYQSHMLSKMTTYINDLKYLRNERVEFQAKMRARVKQAMALKRMVNALQAEKASLRQDLVEKEEYVETIGRKHQRDLQNAQKTLLTHDASKQVLAKQKAKYQDLLQTSKQQMITLQKEIEELDKKNEGLELLIESKDQFDNLSQQDPISDQSNEDLKRELSRLQQENKTLKENAEKEKVRDENQSQTRDEEIAKLQNDKRELEYKLQKLQDSDKTRTWLPNEVDVVSVDSNSTEHQSIVDSEEANLHGAEQENFSD